jgi:pimeloyl-[acyl-carrier protein] synthase
MQSIESLANLDLTKVAELGNELLAKLNIVREASPIAWSDIASAWVVTRHEDVERAYSGELPLSNIRFDRCFDAIPPSERATRIPLTIKSVPLWIVNADPPYHTRLRKLLTRAFSKKVVEAIRPFARATIKAVLDQAAARGDVEFVNEVARAVTGRVIMRILGIPEQNLGRLEAWSLAFNAGFGGAQAAPEVLDDVERAMAEMDELFTVEIARRRERPTEDFISEMVVARDGLDRLSDEEIKAVCYVTLVAGHDTTMNSMTLGVVALANDTSARQYLVDHPDQTSNCVMEVMRYSAMSTMQPRMVSADFEWHGQRLKKGDAVFVMIAGANRDPRVFSAPETIDMTRPTDDVLVFGSGIHHCIGHLLAKMQLGEFFPEFLRRFSSMEILDQRLQFQASLAQRGLVNLRVRLKTRKSYDDEPGAGT